MTRLARSLVLVAAVAAVANADSRADALFKQGKQELAAKKYESACRDFKSSLDLDPTAIGTMLNLAHCYEEWGRLATGYDWYKTARERAAKVHDDRVKGIDERIKALDPQVPRLTVNVGGALDGLEVSLDGAPLATDKLGTEMMVDPGPHVVVVRRGADKRERTVPVEAGGSSEIRIEPPPVGAVAAGSDAATTTASATASSSTATSVSASSGGGASDGAHTKRVAGAVLAGGGVAAMAVAGIVTLRAKSRYDAALKGDCGGSTSMCDPEGLSATASARKEANVSSIIFGGGAALAAAGVVLYLTSRHGGGVAAEHALRVVPQAAGVGLAGSF
nr:hypothetical protein [Kofleriaceae bacterium]